MYVIRGVLALVYVRVRVWPWCTLAPGCWLGVCYALVYIRVRVLALVYVRVRVWPWCMLAPVLALVYVIRRVLALVYVC